MTTAQPQVRLVKDLTEEQMNEAVRVWAAAFRQDDFARACSGGDESFYQRFLYSTLLAAAKGGEVYFASLGDTPVAGVAAWFPPGHALLDTPEQGKGGFDDLFGDFTPELRTWWTEYFLPKYETHTTEALGEGFKVAAWHLQFIGVLPELQHRGIGSALIDFVNKQAVTDGKSLCLETEKESTVAFYKSCGFYLKEPVEDYESYINNFKMWILVKDN